MFVVTVSIASLSIYNLITLFFQMKSFYHPLASLNRQRNTINVYERIPIQSFSLFVTLKLQKTVNNLTGILAEELTY